jgi:hypothetical protein
MIPDDSTYLYSFELSAPLFNTGNPHFIDFSTFSQCFTLSLLHFLTNNTPWHPFGSSADASNA